jgi:hypothetical protein
MEKLDLIRNRCFCFIDYDSSLSAIRVSPSPELSCAAQDNAVVDAIKGIRHEVCKLMLDVSSNSSTLLKSFHVQIPSISIAGMKVKLEDKGTDRNKLDYQVPILVYPQDNGAGSTSKYSGNTEVSFSNETPMRLAVKNALPGLQFFRGQVQMRANFGSFRLKGYRKPVDSYRSTIDEFREILRDQNTDGYLFSS